MVFDHVVALTRGGGGAKLNNVLYKEALPPGPTPPSSMYTIFDRKGTPFLYL